MADVMATRPIAKNVVELRLLFGEGFEEAWLIQHHLRSAITCHSLSFSNEWVERAAAEEARPDRQMQSRPL